MFDGTEWPHSPFWDWSLTVYGRPGVEAACLELQRRHGLDVNLILLCCWLGVRGVELDRVACEPVRQIAEAWQDEVVRPLRAIREGLKIELARRDSVSLSTGFPDLAAALRARVLDLELDGEHIEQLALEQAVAGLPAGALSGPGLAARNLAGYRRFREHDRPALLALLRAAFPDAAEDEIGGPLSPILDAPPGEG